MLLNERFDIARCKTNAMADLDVTDKLAINPAIDGSNANATFRGEFTLRQKCCRIVQVHYGGRVSNRSAADKRKQTTFRQRTERRFDRRLGQSRTTPSLRAHPRARDSS
jgi:hypothetical protein